MVVPVRGTIPHHPSTSFRTVLILRCPDHPPQPFDSSTAGLAATRSTDSAALGSLRDVVHWFDSSLALPPRGPSAGLAILGKPIAVVATFPGITGCFLDLRILDPLHGREARQGRIEIFG